MSDDENDDKLTAGENKINICQINEMITCKVKKEIIKKKKCELSPSDLLWLLSRRHHSDRMPAHILQGNIPHLSCIHFQVILQSCIVKHLEDNINCPECEVIFTLC